MVKKLLISSSLFFSGCNDTNNNTTNINITPVEVIDNNSTNNDINLEKTQWYATYNEEFYTLEAINKDANIHGDSIYSKYTGKGIKVAIIDNGFDTTHPEFKDRIIKKINCSGVGASDDVSYDDSSDNYHGTATAGIIGAAKNDIGIRGIAPDSELILVKMSPYSTDLDTVNMFKKVVDAGADIISCSWGTYNVSDSVKDYINTISINKRDGKGVVVVFASGNDNQLMGNDESAIEGVIGVGATDHQNLRTTYSNYGKNLDIVAPGGGQNYGNPGITTLDIQGENGASNDEYNRYNEVKYGSESSFIGTSASAPVISGALALVLQANPNITRLELQELLKSSSDKIGLNLPYLIDYEVVNDNTPLFYGTLGINNTSNFSLYLKNNDINKTYGPYGIDLSNNSWSANIQDTLPEGFYSSYLVSDKNQILATDKEFEINLNKTTITHSTRNDYYGYGKINLNNIINNL